MEPASEIARCPRCDRGNPTGARFCRECGQALRERCARCGTDVPFDAKYCSECGTERGPGADVAPARAERRHLSVLFCDVVGSTPISERLDAEDFREVLRAFQRTVGEAVRAHDGRIAQYVGDGIVAYFGAPHAQEDAARRAVRAGLDLLERLDGLNATLEAQHGLTLRLHIGIHSGMVVLGEIGDEESPAEAAVGQTMHLASRLCDQAPPDQVIVSGATHLLVDGYFAVELLGNRTMRGLASPIATYRVTKAIAVESGGLENRPRWRQTPFVDREAEMAVLLERWAAAKEGHGQVILLGGEPGIGKSRLVQRFRERIQDDDHLAFGTECSPYHRASALHPFLQIFERSLRFRPDATPEEKLDRIERVVGPFLTELPDAVPLLAMLLSIDVGERYPLPTMTPQRQRRQTLEVLLWLMSATARIKPVLIVLDDLHWADPSTLDFLDTLIEQTASARLLTVLSHRPEFVPPWRPRAHVTRMTVGPLQRPRVEAVVRGTVAPDALGPAVVAAVAERAEGNPLFAEELARMMVEREPARASGRAADRIPPTLRDWLAARLDHLGSAKLVAQIAAIIGRTFSYKALRALAPLEESRLCEALTRLTGAELVYQRGLPPRSTYTFKHALIQEAAYDSVLRSERRQHHLALAEMLEQGFPEGTETTPEIIARHYAEAGRPDAAIALWLRAAERAVARSENAEAIEHLRRGLTLVPDLTDPTVRAERELALLVALAMPLALQQGYAAPEIDRVFVRARAVAEQLGSTPYLFGIVRGMLGFSEVGARYDDAREMAAELERLADLAGDPAWTIEAAWEQGSVALFTGRLADARRHLERAIAIYDPDVHRANAYLFGEDPGVMARVHASLACWLMGESDTAVRHAESGVELATAIDHPNSLAMALCFAAAVHRLRDDVEPCVARAKAALRVGAEQHFPIWVAMATVYLGWAAARSGRHAEGITCMREGIALWEATGAKEAIPAMQAMVAEALLRDGRGAEAEAVLVPAVALARQTGERFYEPELHRLLGEARRTQGASDHEVEQHLARGLEVARACGAVALELRLASDLGRLRTAQGRPAEGHALVADVHARMPERSGPAAEASP
jgi:class 3 adenylate cyclase/predicted ATPase